MILKVQRKPYNSIKWENDKVGIKLNNNMNRVYSQVDFQWCDESNQYIEVSSVSSDYAGDWALCTAVTNQTDTDVGYAAGITTAAAIVQFNKANVTFPLITKGYAATGTTSVSFPEYSKLGVSDVTNNAAGNEGDHQNAVALTVGANTVEVLRHNIHANLTDLAAHSQAGAMSNAGLVLGNAVAAEFDNQVCAAFDGFDTSKGTSTDGLKFLDIMDALALLEANDAPRPYSAVLHPQQMFGSFGLSNEFGSSAVNASNGAFNGLSGAAEQQFMGTGFVTSLAGINFYTSPQVPNGADATEKKGAVFAQTALGAAMLDMGGGSFMQVAMEREETQASTVIVANGYFAVTELVDEHGVEIHTEIS